MDPITSRAFNAGQADNPYDLEATRQAAQARANAAPRGAVRIYRHVGGRHPSKGLVAGTGAYLWRDVEDDDGQPYNPPQFVWAAVETVLPEVVA